jgi:hypothetical protein
VYVCEVVVFDIVLQFVPPSFEYSHLITRPVSPLNVRVPLLVPEHTVALLVTLPPTVTAVILKAAEVREVTPEAETLTLYDVPVIAVEGMAIVRMAFVGAVKVPEAVAIGEVKDPLALLKDAV